MAASDQLDRLVVRSKEAETRAADATLARMDADELSGKSGATA